MQVKKDKNNLKRMYKYMKPYTWRFIVAVVFMSMFAGLAGAVLVIVKQTVDGIFIDKNISMLVVVAIAVPLAFALKGLADYGRSYLLSYIGQNVIKDLRMDLYKKLISLSHGFYVENSTPKLMSRVTNDLGAMQNAIVRVPATFIKDGLTLITMVTGAFILNWKFALITFLGFPIAAIPLIIFARKIRKAAKEGNKQMAELYSSLHQMLNGFSVIKAFNTEPHEHRRFIDDNNKLYNIVLRIIRVDARSSPIMNFMGAAAVSVVLFFGGMDVVNGVWTAGAFMAFVAAVGQIYEPIKSFTQVNSQIQSGLAAAERVFEILNEEPTIKNSDNAAELKNFNNSIVYHNVTFGYLPDKDVIKNFNVTISRGETVAFVGHSGSGKTTIANLLLRFYDPKEGKISIDGHNIKNLTLKSLRDHVGIVTQDVTLFDDTVKYNISYGSFGASTEDIIKAAKLANAHNFISKLPNGYDTMVGERGMKLSGGEKQRISIARAMLKNPPILVLDEATSALDSESEKLVQAAIDNLMKDRTVILIAHRLATVRNANKIIVMDKGQIIESGTHNDLIKLDNGVYRKLNELQLL